jgi:hypothetical protein
MNGQISNQKTAENPPNDAASAVDLRSKAGVLAKLKQAGAKGLSLARLGPKSKNARALLDRTLADLAAHKSVTQVVTSGRAIYYLSQFAPGLESVSAKLERQAREAGGSLLSRDDLKALLTKPEIPYFTPALCRLLGEKVLVKLQHIARRSRNGNRRETDFYLHRATLQEKTAETFRPDSGDGRFSSGAKMLLQAYHDLVLRNGFPDVEIAELQQELGIPIPEVATQILEERDAGRAVLSFGDWSLASEKTRLAAIQIDGERYLRVRFQG